jgi:hypothetical protein
MLFGHQKAPPRRKTNRLLRQLTPVVLPVAYTPSDKYDPRRYLKVIERTSWRQKTVLK